MINLSCFIVFCKMTIVATLSEIAIEIKKKNLSMLSIKSNRTSLSVLYLWESDPASIMVNLFLH